MARIGLEGGGFSSRASKAEAARPGPLTADETPKKKKPSAVGHPSGRGELIPPAGAGWRWDSASCWSAGSAGLVLPGTTQDSPRRRHRQGAPGPAPAARARGRGRNPDPGHHRLLALPSPRKGRAALDHRDAPAASSATSAAADRLLRPDEDRGPSLARHDGRRGHSKPRRDRAGRARRRPPDRDVRARRSCSTSAPSSLSSRWRSCRSSASSCSSRSRPCGPCFASARRSTPRSRAG